MDDDPVNNINGAPYKNNDSLPGASSNAATAWPTPPTSKQPKQWPRLPDLTAQPPRNLVWVAAGGEASVSRLGLSATWNLHSIKLPVRGPMPALGNIRVGLIDLGTPTQERLDRLCALMEAHPEVKWIALISSRLLAREEVRALIRENCYDFHSLPLDLSRLEVTLGRAHGMAELEQQKSRSRFRDGASTAMPIIGASSAMKQLNRRLIKVAASQVPVLIQGECGTGKELAAQALHRHSSRAHGPFVAINCGALPAQLIQSELFGHEAGAFTGAGKRKLGQLELADGGTLLLDEVGDLDMELQVNLLRFLQEGTLWRVGGLQPIQLDVRVVAATHVNLAEAVAEGRFREDLYYRLNVIQLDIPPLRERGPEDLSLLAHFTLQRLQSRAPHLKGFSRSALKAMSSHSWPGNVRELINRIQRALAMAEGRWIRPQDMGLYSDQPAPPNATLTQARNQADREAVAQALQQTGFNVSRAARQLGVGRMTLYRLIKKHHITLVKGPGEHSPETDGDDDAAKH
ncbi:MAG: sigma-54-dependent Fis family transcriptional regulator [Halomonadaceae bacterium]|nr:MAG: sigma-54-dependent Fis family transcriptional regulator [Halomonadaceae bacterium]